MTSQTRAASQEHRSCWSRCTFDPDDFEQISRTLTVLTIHPIKSLASYFFPIFGAVTSGYAKVNKRDIAQKARISDATRDRLYKEVEELKGYAQIRRDISVYTGLIHSFHSFGGECSLTSPLVAIPHHRLIRPEGPDFGFENPDTDRLANHDWFFSDDETRFFISRELGHIKHNDAMIRILTKILIIAAAFFMYFGPLGILGGVLTTMAAVALYVVSERCFQSKMDLFGVEILGRKYGDELKATDVAIHALKKIQQQNIARRTDSLLARMYISKTGNNFLAIHEPLLSTRISRLEQHREKLQ